MQLIVVGANNIVYGAKCAATVALQWRLWSWSVKMSVLQAHFPGPTRLTTFAHLERSGFRIQQLVLFPIEKTVHSTEGIGSV
jgi:hypothetical protein